MPPRSFARWLAPLALLAAALALLVVLTTSSSDPPTQDSAVPSSPSTTTPPKRPAPSTTTTARRATTGPTSGKKSYTVQAGDFLSTVSEKTGVPVARLRELNPGLDANSMTVGQQIRLEP